MRKQRELTVDERDLLYKLANWVEEHGDTFAMCDHSHVKPHRILLRRGYVMKADFTNGRWGLRLLQSGYDEAYRLWDEDAVNNPEAKKSEARS